MIFYLRMKWTDGALIRASSPGRESPAKTLRTQTELVRLFKPLLAAYVPR